MSYSLGQTKTGAIQVGQKARYDPILAKASLRASELLLLAARRPAPNRPSFIRRELRQRYGPRVLRRYERERVALRGTRSPDQALYDALRLAIADHLTRIGVMYLQSAMAEKYGSGFVPAPLQGGLGDEARDIGCAVGGGATALLAAVIGGFTAGVGAPLVGAGGQLALTAAGCGAEGTAAQQGLSEAEAALAQAELDAAAETAAAEEAARQQRNKTIMTVAAVGGGVLLLGVVGYVIVGT